MSDRTISVSEDTWRALRARSRADESLDETIGRLLEAVPAPDRAPDADDRDLVDEEIDEAVREMTMELERDFEDEDGGG